MSEWINVHEKLPPDLVEVLYFSVNDTGARELMCGHRENGQWMHCCLFYSSVRLDDETCNVTHWMHLPGYPELS